MGFLPLAADTCVGIWVTIDLFTFIEEQQKECKTMHNFKRLPECFIRLDGKKKKKKRGVRLSYLLCSLLAKAVPEPGLQSEEHFPQGKPC